MRVRKVCLGLTAAVALGSTATASDTVAVAERRLKYPEQIQRQKLLDRQKMFTLGQGDSSVTSPDSVRSLMDIFYTDQFRAVSDPEAPYFMMMTKDTHLAMGIGGLITVRGWEDWNGVVDSYIFTPYNIPIPKVPSQMKRLAAAADFSRVYLTLLGRNTAIGDFMAYLEAGFQGYNRMDFKLRRAYIRLRGFTAGYALSTFVDVGALPRMVDGGLHGATADRANILVRYSHDFQSGWGVAGGLEFPKTYIADPTGETEACLPYLPDVAAYGQYGWAEGFSHIRLTGLLRTLTYRNIATGLTHNKVGWALALSASVKALPNLTFYGIGLYGAGHAGYLGDISSGSHDLVAIAGQPGKLQLPQAFSYFIGAKYHFRPDLYATATFTQIRNYEKNPVDLSSYKYGLMGGVNLFWEITPRLTIGGEYIIGERKNFDGAHGSSNRAEAMFQLSF